MAVNKCQKKLARNDVSMMYDDIDMGLSAHFYKYLNSAFENYKQEYDHISRVKLSSLGLKVKNTTWRWLSHLAL